MAMATTSSRLTTTFSSTPCSPTTMAGLPQQRRHGSRYPRIQAIDLDQNTVRKKCHLDYFSGGSDFTLEKF
jgi:hypothetical protein